MPALPIAIQQGYLPTAQTVLYTVPAGKILFVGNITAQNIHGNTQTVEFWVNRAGVDLPIYRVSDFGQWFKLLWGQGIVLEAGDTLSGKTTNANAVAYLISGALL